MAEVVLNNVRKNYDPAVHKDTLRNINLAIKEGEFIVFVGPSGCGKSTLLRMIAGLEDITSGELTIGGRYMNDVPPVERNVGMVFQSYALYPHMNIYENMAFGLKLKKMDKESIHKRVMRAAEILGLEPLLDRKPKALSGGQRDHAVFQHGHALGVGEALEGDAPQHFAAAAQLDQHRQLAGNGEQGAGERVVGQVRGFVVLQAGQRFALDAGAVSRQPDAGGAVGQRQVLFLQPQQGAVVPVHVAHHGGDAGGGDYQGEGEAAAAGEGHLRALGDFEPLRLRTTSESSVKSARALRARGYRSG